MKEGEFATSTFCTAHIPIFGPPLLPLLPPSKLRNQSCLIPHQFAHDDVCVSQPPLSTPPFYPSVASVHSHTYSNCLVCLCCTAAGHLAQDPVPESDTRGYYLEKKPPSLSLPAIHSSNIPPASESVVLEILENTSLPNPLASVY